MPQQTPLTIAAWQWCDSRLTHHAQLQNPIAAVYLRGWLPSWAVSQGLACLSWFGDYFPLICGCSVGSCLCVLTCPRVEFALMDLPQQLHGRCKMGFSPLSLKIPITGMGKVQCHENFGHLGVHVQVTGGGGCSGAHCWAGLSDHIPDVRCLHLHYSLGSAGRAGLGLSCLLGPQGLQSYSLPCGNSLCTSHNHCRAGGGRWGRSCLGNTLVCEGQGVYMPMRLRGNSPQPLWAALEPGLISHSHHSLGIMQPGLPQFSVLQYTARRDASYCTLQVLCTSAHAHRPGSWSTTGALGWISWWENTPEAWVKGLRERSPKSHLNLMCRLTAPVTHFACTPCKCDMRVTQEKPDRMVQGLPQNVTRAPALNLYEGEASYSLSC